MSKIIFISIEKDEMSDYISDIQRKCNFYGFDVIFSFNISPKDIPEQIKKSDYFFGIYGEEYGGKIIKYDGIDNKISKIDYELRIAVRDLPIENITLFCNKSIESIRDDDFQSLLKRHQKLVYRYKDKVDLLLNIEVAIKNWNHDANILSEKSVTSDHQIMSITLKTVDKRGLMLIIFRSILNQGGNVIQGKQDIYSNIATTRIIAEWTSENTPPSPKEVKDSINAAVVQFYGTDEIEHFELTIKPLRSFKGDVQAKGQFIIEFFDGRGIGERIFREISQANISVLESSFMQINVDTPIIGQFNIVFDANDFERKQILDVAEALKKCPGVFRVEESIQIGNWWY